MNIYENYKESMQDGSMNVKTTTTPKKKWESKKSETSEDLKALSLSEYVCSWGQLRA